MSLLWILIGLWGIIFVILVALMLYRGVIGRNEETELMVDQAEHRFADEQRDISARITQLSTPIRFLSIAAGALLLIIIAVWLYQGLQNS
jgi:hypothetical protein